MPIEIGPLSPVRPVRPGAQPSADRPARSGAPVQGPDEPEIRIAASALAAAPPIDAERVALIRAAIADGTYPVIPARIADAMIAAGLLLRSGR